MRKHLGIALVGLLLIGAGCAASQTPPRVSEDTNTPQVVNGTASGSGSNEIASWKQTKLGFVVRIPATWRIVETDAGNAALIRVFASASSEADAQIFTQAPRDVDGNTVVSFDQWVKNGGKNVGQVVSNVTSQGEVVVDGVVFSKKYEGGSVTAYYGRLQTAEGEVFLRYSYSTQHPKKNELEQVFRAMRFSPTDDELEKAYDGEPLKFRVPQSWVVKAGDDIGATFPGRGEDVLVTSESGVLVSAVSSGGPFCADGEVPGVCFEDGVQIEITQESLGKAPTKLIATQDARLLAPQNMSWCEGAGCPKALYYYDGVQNDFRIEIWYSGAWQDAISRFLETLHE